VKRKGVVARRVRRKRGAKLRPDEQEPDKRLLWPDEWATHHEVHNYLNTNWFLSLDDAKRKIEAWREHHDASRPHTALGYVPPSVFAQQAARNAGHEPGLLTLGLA
jgi:hypothetical protein